MLAIIIKNYIKQGNKTQANMKRNPNIFACNNNQTQIRHKPRSIYITCELLIDASYTNNFQIDRPKFT